MKQSAVLKYAKVKPQQTKWRNAVENMYTEYYGFVKADSSRPKSKYVGR